AEPMPNIAAQHERVIGGLALGVLVGDKGEERNGNQLDLLVCHFVELWDLDDHGILQLLEVRRMGCLIPLEEVGVIDEALDQEILASGVDGAVSSISFNEAIDEPRMWNTTKVICPFLTASRNPISRKACSVGDINPARTSTTVTVASVVDSVSMMRI